MMTEEKILQECYRKLAKKHMAKTKQVDPAKDASVVSGIATSTSLLLTQLTSPKIILTDDKMRKYVITAKGLYTQFCIIKGRNPSCLSPILEQHMAGLINAVCRYEAEMIRTLLLEEADGAKIDLQAVFDQTANLNRLGSVPADRIVADFILRLGKLPIESFATVDLDHTCVTAFIDESIHSVAWDEKGQKGKCGSYSYIICLGNLTDEWQISENRIITQGVDYAGEHKHIEKITETAISKVLVTLAYDYEYAGPVQIYTDNWTAAHHWCDLARNARLAKQFVSVKVTHIPRQRNRKADELCRSRMLLDMPIDAYNEAVKNKLRVKELEKQVRRLEAGRIRDTEIPEVIVAKRAKGRGRGRIRNGLAGLFARLTPGDWSEEVHFNAF